MKKRILLFFCLIICCFPLFANKERFYEESKILRIMYVNSVEGLRVREKPDLNSKKICTLPYRFFVKIVKIENEVVIDGIKDPWVKILLPRTEWEGEMQKYGYVFGGYLQKQQSSFDINKINIENFLTQCDWSSERSAICFYPNHYCLSINYDSEWFDGKWSYNYSTKKIYVDWNSPYDDTIDCVEYSVKIIDENNLEINGKQKTASIINNLTFYNRNTNEWKPSLQKAENFNLLNLYFQGGNFIISELQKLNILEENKFYLIESGIYSEIYKKEYDDYWNTIIDKMK